MWRQCFTFISPPHTVAPTILGQYYYDDGIVTVSALCCVFDEDNEKKLGNYQLTENKQTEKCSFKRLARRSVFVIIRKNQDEQAQSWKQHGKRIILLKGPSQVQILDNDLRFS